MQAVRKKFDRIFLKNLDADNSWFSYFSALSLFSATSVASFGGLMALLSVASFASSLSVASAASSLSILSAGSVTSVLSIGSTNCVFGFFEDCTSDTAYDATAVAFICLLNLLIPLLGLLLTKLTCCGLRHIKVLPASGEISKKPMHLRVREVQARAGVAATNCRLQSPSRI